MSQVTSSSRRSPVSRPPARGLALAVLCLSAFVVNVDTTIVNVALPTLVTELGAGTRDLQWVVDAYLLVFAALVLAGGAPAPGRRAGARPAGPAVGPRRLPAGLRGAGAGRRRAVRPARPAPRAARRAPAVRRRQRPGRPVADHRAAHRRPGVHRARRGRPLSGPRPARPGP